MTETTQSDDQPPGEEGEALPSPGAGIDRVKAGAVILAALLAASTVAGAVAWQQEASSNERLRRQVRTLENEVASSKNTQTDEEGGERVATKTIYGAMTLTDYSELWREGDRCSGSGGYRDIHEGAQVRVTDGGDNLLAVAELAPGVSPGPGRCEFSFSVQDVPAADFYEVEVSQRGGISFSHADLEAQRWRVDLTLG